MHVVWLVVSVLCSIGNAHRVYIDSKYTSLAQMRHPFVLFGASQNARLTASIGLSPRFQNSQMKVQLVRIHSDGHQSIVYSQSTHDDTNSSNSDGNSYTTVTMDTDINEKGVYAIALKLTNADTNTNIGEMSVPSELSVSGFAHIKNKNGELSPNEYNEWCFYNAILWFLLSIGVVWSAMLFKFRQELVKHHFALSCVLFASVAEAAIKCIAYSYSNSHSDGTGGQPLMHLSIQVVVIRRTLARLLCLGVSLGWGVTLPKLTKAMKTVLIRVGVLYYVLSSVAEHMLFKLSLFHKFDEQRSVEHILLPVVFGQCLLDAMIFYTIFDNLAQITKQLHANKQWAKFDHYRKFLFALFALLLLCFVMTWVYSYIALDMRWVQYFDSLWLFKDGMWHVFYICAFLSILTLWRPSKASRIYAYLQQLPCDDHDLDLEFDDAFTPENGKHTMNNVSESNCDLDLTIADNLQFNLAGVDSRTIVGESEPMLTTHIHTCSIGNRHSNAKNTTRNSDELELELVDFGMGDSDIDMDALILSESDEDNPRVSDNDNDNDTQFAHIYGNVEARTANLTRITEESEEGFESSTQLMLNRSSILGGKGNDKQD